MSSPLHKVLEVRFLTPQCFRLTVERRGLDFIPGQCVNIGLPGAGVNREYSSYSSASDRETLGFLIRLVEGGDVSSRLASRKPGDLVEIHGAYGSFVLPSPVPEKADFIFLATGTGIAPFHSFVKSHPGLRYRLIHGVRHLNERYDRETYESGRYFACVSQEPGGDFHGRLTAYLATQIPHPTATYYLCGNRAMIVEAYELLREQGVNGDRLVTEVFF